MKWYLTKNSKCEERKKTTNDTIHHLTCITFNSSPSRSTQRTRSTLYVTRIVFTVGRARNVTVTTVDTGFTTSYIIQISSTRLKREKFSYYNINEIYWRGTAKAGDPRSYLVFSIYQFTLKISTFKYLCFLMLHKLIAAEYLLNQRIIS